MILQTLKGLIETEMMSIKKSDIENDDLLQSDSDDE